MPDETRALLLRCLRIFDGMAGEGVSIQGLEQPVNVYWAIIDHLEMSDDEAEQFREETARMIEDA